MQESIRTCVFERGVIFPNMDCVWIKSVLCSMYDIGICVWCKLCGSPPSHVYEQEHARKYKDVCVFNEV